MQGPSGRERVTCVEPDVLQGSIGPIVESLRAKGVRVWAEHGRLHYQAPKGVLTEQDLAELRSIRAKLLAHLETQPAGPDRVGSPAKLQNAPLSFTQLAHWNTYRLSERPAIRQVAAAMRLRGRLDVDAMRAALVAIVHRHDALRTRIVMCAGAPVQVIDAEARCELELRDLTAMTPGIQEREIAIEIDRFVMQPINVSVGPLFGARLLQLGSMEHVLIVAMEHLISDAFSRGILLRELFAAYEQLSRGNALAWPDAPTQYADYALAQRCRQQAWLDDHESYWKARLQHQRRVRFPEDRGMQTAATADGWEVMPVRIAADLRRELSEWSRQRQTTLVMTVFTAYAALALHWCGASEQVFLYETSGRTDPAVANTIGYFAAPLYLRLHLTQRDSFEDLLSSAVDEYCRAYEHADSSYLAAQVPEPDFTANTAFNWVPREANTCIDASADSVTIDCSPLSFEHPMVKNLDVDREPGLLLYDLGEEVTGGVYFPRHRFSRVGMEAFGRAFLQLLAALPPRSGACVQDLLRPLR